MMLRTFFLAALVASFALATFAHDGVEHKTQDEALRHQAETANTAGFPDIKGGDFTLIDHNGQTRTVRDPDGRYQLLFFGYANCKAICSVALPRMAQAVDLLDDKSISVTPLLVTVDPERDTVANMKEPVRAFHPRMVGLTGSEEALAEAYKAFQIEKKKVYDHPEEGPIYAHGTYIYLLAPNGAFKTLLPPILSPERIAEIVSKYVENDG